MSTHIQDETRPSLTSRDSKLDDEKAYGDANYNILQHSFGWRPLIVSEVAVPFADFDDPNIDKDDAMIGVLGEDGILSDLHVLQLSICGRRGWLSVSWGPFGRCKHGWSFHSCFDHKIMGYRCATFVDVIFDVLYAHARFHSRNPLRNYYSGKARP